MKKRVLKFIVCIVLLTIGWPAYTLERTTRQKTSGLLTQATAAAPASPMPNPPTPTRTKLKIQTPNKPTGTQAVVENAQDIEFNFQNAKLQNLVDCYLPPQYHIVYFAIQN